MAQDKKISRPAPYQTSDGTTVWLRQEFVSEVDENGKYVPGSTTTNLRYYPNALSEDYVTIATRKSGENWKFNNVKELGPDLKKTLSNKNSILNVNLNNATFQTMGQKIPFPAVASGAAKENTNTKTDIAAAAGIPAPAENPEDTTSEDTTSEDTQLTPTFDVNQISGRATDDIFDTLRYPKTDAVGDKFDYLKIDVIKYVPPGLGVNANFNVKRFDEPGGEGRATNILGSVFLPMQPGITDSNGASWNEDRLNPFQAALGGTAAEALNNFGGGNIGRGVAKLLENIKTGASTLAGSGNVQNYLTAYFAGEAVGANIIARQTGAVINNNLELLFNGPKLRTFQYNFRFTPRDDKEAGEIKKIIRVFKRNLAPSQTSDGLFLASPNVFRLKYIYGNTQDQHPFLNKIGTCALTDMSVNYTPDGTYMTYGEDGSMTSYTMTLQFSELNPIYREDYDTPEGKQGMGY